MPGQIPEVAKLEDLGQPPGTEGPIIGPYVRARIADIDLSTVARVTDGGPQRPVRPRRGDGEFVPDMPSEADPVVQREFDLEGRGPNLSSPILNFDGIVTGSSPHDPNLDVGPNHVIQMVNTQFQIFNKAGASLAGPSLISSIWVAAGVGGVCTGNAGDPVVLYDQLADRWFISQFQNPSHLCFAVSQGPNPVTSGWFVYTFNVGTFPDYFKVGVWPSAYFVGAQIGGNQAMVAAFNRGAMLTGAAANFVQFNVAGLTGAGGALGFDLILPSDLDGATAPPSGAGNIYYRQVDGNFWGGADRLDLFRFDVNFGVAPPTASFTALPAITTAAFDAALCGFNSFSCVPQPGTAVRLDPINEPPMYPFRYRNFGSHETLVGNFAVDANAADGAGIRWFELRRTGGNWFLQQEGTYAPQPGGGFEHRWMGAAAMDGSGNIALLYNVSGTADFPGIRYSGRLASDAAGTLPQAEETLINGGSSFLANTRFGDYGSLSVDPADNCTFWGIEECTLEPPTTDARASARSVSTPAAHSRI